MSKKNKKHAAPLRCRLQVLFRGRSPSNSINRGIGARGCGRRCQRCSHNRREIDAEAFAAALADMSAVAVETAKSIEICMLAIKNYQTTHFKK